MTKTLEHEWELELPAGTPEQLLAALTARDRLFGQSITLEPEEDPKKAVEVWLGTTDALEGKTFHLGVYAELTGPAEFLEAARDALEDIIAGQIEAAAEEAGEAELLETTAAADIEFRQVPEEDEKMQLIMPGWLAPDDVDLPWGFLPFGKDGKPWPGPKTVEAHERLVVLPVEGEYRLFSLPPIEDED
jgi:hypothetical protein